MGHWLDRLALRAAMDPLEPATADTAARPPLSISDVPTRPGGRPFTRLAGIRAFGLAFGLMSAAPLIRPIRAAATSFQGCEPACLAAAEDLYRRATISCNSGVPQPLDFLLSGLRHNPLCQAVGYQRLVTDRRKCVVLADCGRKQPPPPAPPPPKRGPTPSPAGGCGPIGMTNCEGTCCPAGYLCSGSVCFPPPPPAEDQCNPPCPPGKKCQKGQCVDVSSDCGTCPPGAKCCSGCSFGAYCAAADFECRC